MRPIVTVFFAESMRTYRPISIAVAVLGVLVLGIGIPSDSRADPPPAPPAEYEALYDELSQKLTSFEAGVDADWDGMIGDGRFSASLAAANGNKSVALLSAQSWGGSLAMLDAYESLGIAVIKLEMEYPVQTPAFQSWLGAHPPAAYSPYTATVPNFIGTPTSFYNRLVDEIRSRGLGLWIEHGTLFADYSPTPPAAYFTDMRTAGLAATRARYTAERSAEAALVVSELAPDYYTILEEPNTQNDNFGYFAGSTPLFDVAGWTGFVEATAAAIDEAAPGSATLIGAGSGTWDGFTYPQAFAPMPELDYIDLHMYPLQTQGQDFMQNALDWADYIRGVDPGKFVTMGETWLYKASIADLINGTPYNDILGRDVYSFWEPLDTQFLGLIFKMMQQGDFKLVMPFWSQYFYAYLTYGDPELEGLSGPQLIALEGQAAGPNIVAGILTGTGTDFQALIAESVDADGDGVMNTADNCQNWPNANQALPLWSVPAGDPDCDGFASVTTSAGRGRESFMGTDVGDSCADTTTPNDEQGPSVGESSSPWPPDINDTRTTNLSDISLMSGSYNKSLGQAGYDPRVDLNASNVVNLSDISLMSAFYNKSCTP